MSASNPAPDPKKKNLADQTDNDSLARLLHLGHEPRSDLDLNSLLHDVLSISLRSVNADSANILVIDERGWPSCWLVLDQGREKSVPLAHAKTAMEHGIINWVIQNRQGDVIDDLANDPRWSHLPDFIVSDFIVSDFIASDFMIEHGSAICLPLLIYERVTGVLTVTHRTPNFFKSGHLRLLKDITSQVALPIENARLHKAVRRRAKEMAALYEATLNVSADQPLERLLDTIVAQAMDLLRCPGGGLFLWREPEAQLELTSAYGLEIDLQDRYVAPGEGFVGHAFETGEATTLDEHDAHNDSGFPATAALAVPLVWQGRSIGVLLTTDREPGRHFDHNDHHLLTLLANQSAAAIASAQLHESTSRRLQELTFLNETIQDITATLDLDEIFAILTARVKDLLGIEACSIALLDRATRDLVFRAASGGGAETVVGMRVPWGVGIVGATARWGKPINVPDVQRDDRFYQEIDKKQKSFATQSILAAPMISRGEVVGVVEALNKSGGFDNEDERLLSALARLAASVVENANLFNSVRAAEMRYLALFEEAADALWVTDTQGRIIQANRKASALTGCADETMPGTELWTLTLPEEQEIWQTALTQALADEEPTIESWVVGADGIPVPMELRLKQIRAEDKSDANRVQWIGRDISTRRELEQLRENLTHMIVHDLRSPVGTISSSLDLLKGHVGGQAQDQAPQLIDIASRATSRLANLVDSLLDIGRLEAGQALTDRRPIPIKPLVESAMDQMTLYVQQKRIELGADVPENLPLVLADSSMIERVLVNLLDNALKFTPTGGHVRIAIEIRANDRQLKVSVRDDGPGIPPQYQRRVFDKFARVQGQTVTKGIGLGLAFCRLAIQAHGGNIWVESKPGQGATFIFTLPLADTLNNQEIV